jgi:hypothetical protein
VILDVVLLGPARQEVEEEVGEGPGGEQKQRSRYG